MKQYQELLRTVLARGSGHDDRTGVDTVSYFGHQTRYDLREGFPIVTTKRVPFRWVFEELRWFLSGDTNEANLRAAGVDIWKEWADLEHTKRFGREAGDLGPVYGYLWRSFGGRYPERDGVDQIARLVREIGENPNSRRLVVTGWNLYPQKDYEFACVCVIDCKVDEFVSLRLVIITTLDYLFPK